MLPRRAPSRGPSLWGERSFASYVYPGAASLLLGALCVYLAESVPSAVGCVLLFTLAPIAVAIPTLVTITSTVEPAAHRGAVLGILVAVVKLPGLIAPWMTGLIIQARGKNVGVGFHNAYLLASLFLMIVGVVFLACVRPDDELLEEKYRGSVHEAFLKGVSHYAFPIATTHTSRCWPTRSLASSTSARDHASACTVPSSQQE